MKALFGTIEIPGKKIRNKFRSTGMSSTSFQKLNRIRLGLIMAKCLFFTLSWFEWAPYRLYNLNVTIFISPTSWPDFEQLSEILDSDWLNPWLARNFALIGKVIKIVTFKLWSRQWAHSNQLNTKNKHFVIINLSRTRFNFWKFVDDISFDRIFFKNFFPGISMVRRRPFV